MSSASFFEAHMHTTRTDDGEEWTPIKPICKFLGLDFNAQCNYLEEELGLNCARFQATTSEGEAKEIFCITCASVYNWMSTLNSSEVAPHLRVALRQYQEECSKLLNSSPRITQLRNELFGI